VTSQRRCAYFTQLNSNKKSCPEHQSIRGQRDSGKADRKADVLWKLRPGPWTGWVPWQHIQELNPRLIYGTVKVSMISRIFDPLRFTRTWAMRLAAPPRPPLLGRPPTVSAAALGDSNSGMHWRLPPDCPDWPSEKNRQRPEVSVAMQDAVLNLWPAFKLAAISYDSSEWAIWKSIPISQRHFTMCASRGNAARRPTRWVLKCKAGKPIQTVYLFHHPGAGLGQPVRPLASRVDQRPGYSTARARHPIFLPDFADIEKWLADRPSTRRSIIAALRHSMRTVLSMKEIAYTRPAASATIVEVRTSNVAPISRRKPDQVFDSLPRSTGLSCWGEHTDEVLTCDTAPIRSPDAPGNVLLKRDAALRKRSRILESPPSRAGVRGEYACRTH